MDVLQYTAINQQVDYQKQIREKEACYRTLVNEKVATSGGGGTANLVCWLENIEPCLFLNPVNPETPGQYTAQPKYWDCIPQGSGWTSGIKVCDDTGYYRCGRNCSWTVPSGVTCARFQLWGAGSGSGSAYNHSDSPFGSTGAYASAIIPVTAGNTYCLCAGCAYCCYQSSAAFGRTFGCPSYVTGPGFCYFCAEGGEGNGHHWMAHLGNCQQSRFTTTCCNQSGGCWCENGSYVCNQAVCAVCQGPIDFVPGSMYYGCLTCPDIYTPENFDENAIVYGIRGIWSRYCTNSSKYGWNIHPPIYGFENSTQCCVTWTSGNCCGKNCSAWTNSCLRYPGAGGWGSYNWGSYSVCGDAGKFGMVCVSYK